MVLRVLVLGTAGVWYNGTADVGIWGNFIGKCYKYIPELEMCSM